MEAEIAELESFIDSYVGDHNSDPIPSEVFTNTSAKAQECGYVDNVTPASHNGYEYYQDFQQELLDHQRKQESLKDKIQDQYPPFQNWIYDRSGHGNEIVNHQYVGANQTSPDGYQIAPDHGSERLNHPYMGVIQTPPDGYQNALGHGREMGNHSYMGNNHTHHGGHQDAPVHGGEMGNHPYVGTNHSSQGGYRNAPLHGIEIGNHPYTSTNHTPQGGYQNVSVHGNMGANHPHQDGYQNAPPIHGWDPQVQFANFNAPFVQNFAPSYGPQGQFKTKENEGIHSTIIPYMQNYAGPLPDPGPFMNHDIEGLLAPAFPPYHHTYPNWNNPPHPPPMMPPNMHMGQHPPQTRGQISNQNITHANSTVLRSTGEPSKAKTIGNGIHNSKVSNKRPPQQHHCGSERQSTQAEENRRRSDRTTPERPDSGKRSVGGKNGDVTNVKVDRRNSDKTPPKHEGRKKQSPQGGAKKSQSSRHSSQSSSTESTPTQSSKVVSGRSKAEVRGWLRQDSKGTPIEKQMKKMEISQANDLPRLIKSAQTYITNEKKLHDVAEMVCKKAMKNPLFAENGAILCNEMSRRMVDGTSFRTVILNIVQGHYKNRSNIMRNSLKNPKNNSWLGFVTFLVELYLNLHTSSNERLKALVNPIFDCLFQILNDKSANDDITKCFSVNIQKVGSILESANREKMSELMSLLRDHCVMPNDFSTESKRNLLQVLESHARGWCIHPLDNAYYVSSTSEKLA